MSDPTRGALRPAPNDARTGAGGLLDTAAAPPVTAENRSPWLVGFPDELAARAVTDAGALAELGSRLAAAHTVVVIAGSSISGLVLASRLGAEAKRDSGLAVVLVTGGPPVPRRLVAGCTLRWSTVYRFAAAMSVPMPALVDRLGGPGACFRRLALEYLDLPGHARFGENAVPVMPSSPFAAMSTRHGQILTALRASLDPSLPLTVVAGDVPAGERLDGAELPLQVGGAAATLRLPRRRFVVLNATSKPDLLRRPTALPVPDRWSVVAQAPLRPDGELLRCGLLDTGWVPATTGATAPHLAFITPFRDRDTPDARWYGINVMTVSNRRLERIGRDDVVREVSDRLVELESVYGMREIDPDLTRAATAVPIVRQPGRDGERLLDDGSPVVEVHRAFSSGASAIAADGMLGAVIGADSFADAFLEAAGRDCATAARGALAAADRALRGTRRRNLGFELAYFRQSLSPRAGLALAPRRAVHAFRDDFATCGAGQRTQSTVRFAERESGARA